MPGHIRNIIDLHCDTLTEGAKLHTDITDRGLQLSLSKLPGDIRLCQCMAVFIPDELRGEEAEAYFNSVYGYYLKQRQKYSRDIICVTDTAEIEKALSKKRFASILTVEGGAVLNGKLENVERLYGMGVRMMTLTWNAENEICGGADTNTGFTEFGRKAVARMERAGIAVDVSHLSDKGFYELCGFAEKPFLASHSNLRGVCGHRRNLTDDMFREIVRHGGIAGLNYCKSFIREDGRDGTVGDLLKHVYRFLELGGEDALALGSDFDGTDVPDYIKGIEGISFLIEAFEKAGIPAAVTDKILFGNAERYFADLSGGKDL